MSKGKRTISPDNGDDKVPEPYYIGEFRYRNNEYGARYLYPPAIKGAVSVEIQEEFEDDKLIKRLVGSIEGLEITKFKISENTAFAKVVPKPKSGVGEVGASDSITRPKRKEDESPAHGGGALDKDGVFNAVRSRSLKNVGAVGGSSSSDRGGFGGVGGISSNGARGFGSVGGSSSNNDGGAQNSDYEFLRGVENLKHLQRDSIKIDLLNRSRALSLLQEAPSSPTASSSSSMVSSPTPSESPASTSGSSGLGGVNDKSK